MPEEQTAQAVRHVAVRLAGVAQSGLAYAHNDFDVYRYKQIQSLAADILALIASRPNAELRLEIATGSGYATPKVDVRGAVFNSDEELLMVRERADGLWSLPGGWADPGDSPSEAVVREVLEEAGTPVEVTKVVGVWDRDRQGHTPALSAAVYKIFFLCRVTGPTVPASALETISSGWFSYDALPPLSPGRVTKAELDRALEHWRDPSLPTEWD